MRKALGFSLDVVRPHLTVSTKGTEVFREVRSGKRFGDRSLDLSVSQMFDDGADNVLDDKAGGFEHLVVEQHVYRVAALRFRTLHFLKQCITLFGQRF